MTHTDSTYPAPPGVSKISVTVVMATYNGRAFLQAALDSVAAQTVQPIEIIVVDDGSSDGSPDIAEAFGARVIRLSHSGVCEARNTGVREAKGQWIAFLDQDDLWQPTKLERQWNAVQQYPSAVMVATDSAKIDTQNAVILESFVHVDFMRYDATTPVSRVDGMDWFPVGHLGMRGTGWYLLPSAALALRSALLDIGIFDKRIVLNEDVSCFLRLLTKGGLVLVDEPLTGWRIHSTNEHHNQLGMVRGRLALTRVAEKEPASYPDWFVAQLKEDLPALLLELGRMEITAGNTALARSALRAGMRSGGGGRAFLLWAATLVGARNAEGAIVQLRNLRKRFAGGRRNQPAH